ncbi:hypothetical protein BKA82DRAFT_4020929 [Pisolithus tinctorius]|nr:hypothetical protein BKA82DRAFT_4020929 [Pisolithus tinctorius]
MSSSPELNEPGDYNASFSSLFLAPLSGDVAPSCSPLDAQPLDSEFGMDVDDRATPVQDSISCTRPENGARPSRAQTSVPADTAPPEWSSKQSSDASIERFYSSFAQPLSLPEAQARSLNFGRPPTQDVIAKIILRRRRDNGSFLMELDDDVTDFVPPTTGFEKVDELSRMYYNFRPIYNPLGGTRPPLSFVYPMRVVLYVQRHLKDPRNVVFPPPVPINILSLLDYSGPNRIRGVDKHYRPLFHEPAVREVTTDRYRYGAATYSARSIVISDFGVNLFRQLPRSRTSSRTEIMVEYLGMYVMRYVDNIMMTPEGPHLVSEENMNRTYRDLAPSLLAASKPNMEPPFVIFSYVKFDKNLIGCIDGAATESA